MGWFDDLDETVRAGGAWLGDQVGAAPSASAPHQAALDAHTAHPEQSDDFVGSLMQGIGDLGRGVQQEGLAAVLDPFGAMDRQDAQRDLASRFNVSDTPDGDQNSVTPEQFQEIARTYSDIRMGRGNLTLNTDGMSAEDAATFRERTMEDIGDILQTDSGRGLIGELQEGALDADGVTHRETRIGRAADVDSAAGGGRWNDDETHKSGHANYVPGENALPDSGNYRSDVTLFHELTHAYQSTNNNWAQGDVDVPEGHVDHGVANSEYQAAGLGEYAANQYSENAYRRDRMTLWSGLRTLGGDDLDLTERESYNVPGADASAHAHAH